MREDLLGYYERELNFLRRAGADFARRYEKVAGRLLLEPDKCEDPHVERLIEAVAFMSGRIQLKLHDEFPELTESLLNVLYPHYLAPTPSMTVARFALDPQQGKLTSGYNVPRGTTLFAAPVESFMCRFRTCYDVTVWPVEVESARLESRGPETSRGLYSEAVLRLTLRCLNNTTLSDLARAEGASGASQEQEAGPLEDLRFYLRGEAQLAYPLYEMIFNNATRVELRGAGDAGGSRGTGRLRAVAAQSVVELEDALRPVGFAEDEALLPHTPRTFPGYRLLSEYFAFPNKFLFFDVKGVGKAARAAAFGGRFELLIYLRDVVPPPPGVDRKLFQLACTPVVNLFEKRAEPIDLTQRHHEYRVIADIHQPAGTEVYSVDEVTAYAHGQDVRRFHPFYSYRHAENPGGERVFWYASRRPSQMPGDRDAKGGDARDPDAKAKDSGTEVYLSLVDLKYRPRTPSVETLNVWVTCTNRDLPSKLPFGGRQSDFSVERPGPLARAECLHRLTDTVRPAMRRGAHWRLISHLSLNYLSIVAAGDDGTPHALREILMLYDHLNSTATRTQVEGLTRIASRRVTRRVGTRIDEGYVRGVETTIEFGEENFVGSGLYLFASVLERFLGLYASVNSFTQLVATVKNREGVLKRWPPRAGEQQML